MITGELYRETLRDGRAVYLDGARLEDPGQHWLLAKSVAWVADSYDRAYAEAASSEATSVVYRRPGSRDELEALMDYLLASDPIASSTAGCVALSTLADELGRLDAAYPKRLDAFLRACATDDRRVATASEDASGGVRVAERTDEGIVLAGAKQNVLGAALAHELFVVPPGGLGDDEGDRAVAAAVPVSTPGLKLVTTTTAPRAADDRHYPVSRARSMPQSIAVFDEVLVPWERVFLCGETSHAGMLSDTLQIWERARVVAYEADRAVLVFGLAQTISEMNGIVDVPHVREKLGKLAVYASMCRAGWTAALAGSRVTESGMVRPDDAHLFATKSYADHLYSDMLGLLQDVAGGSVITCPTLSDLDNPDLGHYLRKYNRTMEGVSGEDRMRIFHVIRDLSADTYWGWDKVSHQLVGGQSQHVRAAALDSFDIAGAKARACAVAGIAP